MNTRYFSADYHKNFQLHWIDFMERQSKGLGERETYLSRGVKEGHQLS